MFAIFSKFPFSQRHCLDFRFFLPPVKFVRFVILILPSKLYILPQGHYPLSPMLKRKVQLLGIIHLRGFILECSNMRLLSQYFMSVLESGLNICQVFPYLKVGNHSQQHWFSFYSLIKSYNCKALYIIFSLFIFAVWHLWLAFFKERYSARDKANWMGYCRIWFFYLFFIFSVYQVNIKRIFI